MTKTGLLSGGASLAVGRPRGRADRPLIQPVIGVGQAPCRRTARFGT
jgi:hypothetical protein